MSGPIQGHVSSVEPGFAYVRLDSQMPDIPIFQELGVETQRGRSAIWAVRRGEEICCIGPPVASLHPGDPVSGSPASTHIFEPDRSAMEHAIGLRASHDPRLPPLETGIKVVDLFATLTVRGNVGIIGGPDSGRVVLIFELHRRLRSGEVAAQFFVKLRDAPLLRDMSAEDPHFPKDVTKALSTTWWPTDLAGEPSLAADQLDATIAFDAELASLRQYPAIDPLHSRSRAKLEPHHAETAERARALLRAARQLRPTQTLDPSEVVVAERARLLRAYLTQTFFSAERYTERPGTLVPLAQAVDDCAAILDGAVDGVEPERISYAGTLEDALASSPTPIDRFWSGR